MYSTPEPVFFTSELALFHGVQLVQVAVSETPDAGGVAETVQLDAGTTAGSVVVASGAGGVSGAAAVSAGVSVLCPPQAASARAKPAARTIRIANLLLE
jgi:hypothetical protein